MKPHAVALIHREICQSAKCEYLDKINYADPCASCPNGHWGEYDCTDSIRGLGDVVAAFAQPIAKSIDTIFKTNLQNCGGCKKRRATLNKAIPL